MRLDFLVRLRAQLPGGLNTQGIAPYKMKAQTSQEIEAQKKLHWMKCGKCGYDLQTIRWRNVDVDKCFRCGVILLDDGELEKLAGKEEEGQFMSSFIGLFKK